MAINAVSSCSLNLKFYEKSKESNEITIHTLTAGVQLRGEISSTKEMIYYSIKLSLDNKQSSSMSINLTPLKG